MDAKITKKAIEKLLWHSRDKYTYLIEYYNKKNLIIILNI